MTKHETATREEWLAARAELLAREKEHTRLGDEITRARRKLPWVKLEKEYLVTLDQEFRLEDLPKVRKGVYLAEGRACFDALYKVNPYQVRVILTQGIKRQVRRVFAALGYKVKRLERTRIGSLTDRNLKPGTFRILTAIEVTSLKATNRPATSS